MRASVTVNICLSVGWLVVSYAKTIDDVTDTRASDSPVIGSDNDNLMSVGAFTTTGLIHGAISTFACISIVQHLHRCAVMPVLVSRLLKKWESPVLQASLNIWNKGYFGSKI